MEVGAAKTKSAGSGAARSVGRNCPRLQFSIDVKRRVGKIDVRAGMLTMHAGGEDLVTKRKCRFQKSCCSRCSFQMTDVRFDRTESHRVGGKILTTEQIRHALRFDHVAHASRCAVALNQG